MAEAVVSIVVGRLTDLLTEESQLLSGVRDEIQQVVSELVRIKTFLRNADSRTDEKEIRIVLAEVREVAYDAEHVVETFLVKALSTRKRIKWIKTIRFSRKIKDIQGRMSLLFSRFRDCNIKPTLESFEVSSSSSGATEKLKRFYSYATPEPKIFVGFHGDVDLLVGHLVNESDDCYKLVSIFGMGGLGKTTLAEKVYNHSTIMTCFAGLARVTISRKWQRKQVLQRILICLVHEKKAEILNWDEDKLVQKLLKIQQSKKCLIVLDDIWSTDAWDSLKAAFPAENSRSRLMLTSRNVDVAEHADPYGFIHRPAILSPEQSWELLKLKALPKGGDCLDITRDVKKMEELGRKMVGNCGGLPLAIVILGGILVTKPTLYEWEKVYNDSLLSIKSGEGFSKDYQKELFYVLLWSYNDLPPQLKPCFLYLGKFGEDEWRRTESIYQLWIAEGMVLSSDRREGETMMQVAESYMGELVHKCLVQVKYYEVGKFESCSLHDIMRDLSLSQAKANDFFEVVDLREGNDFDPNPSGDLTGYGRQLAVHYNASHASDQAMSYFVKKTNQQRYRSMILLTKSRAGTLSPVLSAHVFSFKLLRVFSLEAVDFDGDTPVFKLGKAIESLVYLRYLSLRNTNLLIFPSVQNLVLLQTLKLDTLGNLVFPPWISENVLAKLGHLRHLYLPAGKVHKLKKDFKLRFDGLSKLETLENFNTDWCEVMDLPKLINLQKLTVTVMNYDVEEMMKYLASIPYPCLRYLALSIISEKLALPDGPDILRKLLCDQTYILQELSLVGPLPEMAQVFGQQPHNSLADVSLVRITFLKLCSSLKEDPMPVLEKIPMLRELHLVGAYEGKEMVCSAMGFPKLTILIVYSLPNIEKWRVENGSMPSLSELHLVTCPKLEELPEGVRFLSSLKILVLYSMPSDLCDRVRVVNGEQGPDFYKVAHIPDIRIETE
ncbi:putative disease resistance protein At1g58400 [Apium graveolens]|uniref:putative disease resistance protein At1g58400 n=1 Tax=Apium graveolens TaxID=4045 RepID=UPI003D7B0D8F